MSSPAPPTKNQVKMWIRVLHANVGIICAVTLGLIAISCPFIAHKYGGSVGEVLKAIHFGTFLPPSLKWIWIDLQGMALLFLVASGWMIHSKTVKRATKTAADDAKAPGSSVTILFDSRHSASREQAESLGASLEESGFRAFKTPVEKYDMTRLAQERWMVFLLSGSSSQISIPPEPRRLPRLEFLGINMETGRPVPLDTGGAISELQTRGAKKISLPSGDGDFATYLRTHLAAAVAGVAKPHSRRVTNAEI